MAQEYYTILTNAGLAYEAQSKAEQTPIRLTHLAVGDGNGAAYNPGQEATALRRETHRQEINALLQDEANPSWLLAEALLPDDVGGFTIREVGIYTDTGILYAIGKYPDSVKPILAQGSTKQFYVRAIFQTSNASIVTLVVDNNVVQATRAYVQDYVKAELSKLDHKNSVRAATTANITLSGTQTIDGVALVAGDRVLVKNQANASQNGIYVVAGGAWTRAADADASIEVTPGLVVAVEQGTTLADTRWQLVTDGAIVLGTTALVFQDVTKGYAPLASPTFTGDPKAPTAPQFDNDASLATTEFVQRALGNFRFATSHAGNYVVTADDVGAILVAASSAVDITYTMPLAGLIASGGSVTIVNLSGRKITLLPGGANTFIGAMDRSGGATSYVIANGDTATVTRYQSAMWLVDSFGNSAAERAPPGELATFAMSTPPTGWLKANGATVGRATYAALFAAIGTTFGAGDGVTTFKLPDLRGEFVRAWDDGRGVDSGRAMGSSQSHAIEYHNHTLPTGSAALDSNSSIWGVKDSYWEEITGPNINVAPVSGEPAVTGSGGYAAYATAVTGTYAGATRPRNIGPLACIKY